MDLSMMTSSQIGSELTSNLKIHPSELSERIKVMRHQEETSYRRDAYFEKAASECGVNQNPTNQVNVSKPVDNECRQKMTEWCFHVVDFFKLRREAVEIAMSYLDRFVCSGTMASIQTLKDRKLYQLAAMTSLFMAIKLFDHQHMSADMLSELSRGCYSTQEIIQMEREILTSLQWRVNGPSSVAFIEHLLCLLPSRGGGGGGASNSLLVAILTEFSKYQTELAVGESSTAFLNPSTVAVAAIQNSMDAMDYQVLPFADRFAFLSAIAVYANIDPYAAEVEKTRTTLRSMFKNISGSELKQQISMITQKEMEYTDPRLTMGSGACSPRCVSHD